MVHLLLTLGNIGNPLPHTALVEEFPDRKTADMYIAVMNGYVSLGQWYEVKVITLGKAATLYQMPLAPYQVA